MLSTDTFYSIQDGMNSVSGGRSALEGSGTIENPYTVAVIRRSIGGSDHFLKKLLVVCVLFLQASLHCFLGVGIF